MAPTATKGEDVSLISCPKVREKKLVKLVEEEKIQIKTAASVFALACGIQIFLLLRHGIL